jgi:hypothetical protein
VDPYTGRYFSHTWIQRNVLRLTDDEIAQMQKEMDEEKEMGIGLPVGVTNAVAQQQMSGDIEAEQQMAMQAHQGQVDSQNQEESKIHVFKKLKQIL